MALSGRIGRLPLPAFSKGILAAGQPPGPEWKAVRGRDYGVVLGFGKMLDVNFASGRRVYEPPMQMGSHLHRGFLFVDRCMLAFSMAVRAAETGPPGVGWKETRFHSPITGKFHPKS